MNFRIISDIRRTETIASGSSVHIQKHLRKKFGPGRWRKMKGVATIEFDDGMICEAELHWFEAHGIGRVYMKRKRNLE